MERFGEIISAEACSGKDSGFTEEDDDDDDDDDHDHDDDEEYDNTKIEKSRMSGFSRGKQEQVGTNVQLDMSLKLVVSEGLARLSRRVWRRFFMWIT